MKRARPLLPFLLASAIAAGPLLPARAQSLTPLSLESARDVTGAGYAFVEMAAPGEAFYVGQAIRLRLRFGFEREFLRANLVQLFQRDLDVAAQLQTRWIDEVPGLEAVDDVERDPDERARATFALDERVAAAIRLEERTIDGRAFAAFEVERTLVAASPGELSIPGPVLAFAYATRFEDDFVQGSIATDRVHAFVRAAALELRIRALPETGRPPEFRGAIGSFSVRAEASPRELRVGESLALALHIECTAGDVARFEAPRLDRLDGFHLRGQIEDVSARRRVITYDLAPASEGVREIPPIAFAFFDPQPPAGYRVARTESIPITVRPARDDSGAARSDGVATGPRPSTEPRWGAATALAIGALGLAALIALALRRRARRPS